MNEVHYREDDKNHLEKFPATPAGGHFASVDDLMKFGDHLYARSKDAKFMAALKKYGGEFYDEKKNKIYHGGYVEGSKPEVKGSTAEFGVSLNSGKTVVVLMDQDASLQDQGEKKLKQSYARGLYKELEQSLDLGQKPHSAAVKREEVPKPEIAPRKDGKGFVAQRIKEIEGKSASL